MPPSLLCSSGDSLFVCKESGCLVWVLSMLHLVVVIEADYLGWQCTEQVSAGVDCPYHNSFLCTMYKQQHRKKERETEREGGREEGKEGEREGRREGGKKGESGGGREGVIGREGRKEGEREGGREGRIEGGREGRREIGREGRRDIRTYKDIM